MKVFNSMIMIILCLALNLYSADIGVGGAELLTRSVSPEVWAAGNTYVTVSDGITPLFYNPAGLDFIKGNELLLFNTSDFGDVTMFGAGYGQILYNQTVGMGIIYKTISGIENVYDLVIIAGYKKEIAGLDGIVKGLEKKVNGDIESGINFKLFNSKLGESSAVAFLLDIGFIYENDKFPLTAGISFKNIGTKIKYESVADSIPLIVSAGVNYKLFYTQKDNRLETGFALNWYGAEKYLSYNFGIQYTLYKVVTLRAGYILNNESYLNDSITLGAGVRYNKFELSYAYSPIMVDDLFYNKHLISLKVSF